MLSMDAQPARGLGVSMWNERKMPERWYELLRRRMQVVEERMRLTKGGYIIEDDQLQKLLMEADSLDREMLLVMRQTVAEALAREELGMLYDNGRGLAQDYAKAREWYEKAAAKDDADAEAKLGR